MICTACGYENSPSRRSCKQCRRTLTSGSVPLSSLAIRDQDHAIELLRDGTTSQQIEARYYLADVFEGRGMLSEAIELLEANGRIGNTAVFATDDRP